MKNSRMILIHKEASAVASSLRLPQQDNHVICRLAILKFSATLYSECI